MRRIRAAVLPGGHAEHGEGMLHRHGYRLAGRAVRFDLHNLVDHPTPLAAFHRPLGGEDKKPFVVCHVEAPPVGQVRGEPFPALVDPDSPRDAILFGDPEPAMYRVLAVSVVITIVGAALLGTAVVLFLRGRGRRDY